MLSTLQLKKTEKFSILCLRDQPTRQEAGDTPVEDGGQKAVRTEQECGEKLSTGTEGNGEADLNVEGKSTKADDKVKGTKGRNCLGCKIKNGKGKKEKGLKFDGRDPCGYHMAGHCFMSDSACTRGVHDYEYGLALSDHWESPFDFDFNLVPKRKTLEKCCKKQDLLRFGIAYCNRIQDKLQPPLTDESDTKTPVDTRPKLFRFLEKFIGSFSPKWFPFVSFRRAPLPLLPEKDVGSDTVAFDIESPAVDPSLLRTSPEYLLVLDLEGKNEIIEFPVLVLRHGVEVGRFHRWVRPAELFAGKTIPEDCPSVPWTQVLPDFVEWLHSRFGIDITKTSIQAKTEEEIHMAETKNQNSDCNYAFVTCGDWDCKHIARQCEISSSPEHPLLCPPGFHVFTNVKKVCGNIFGKDMTKGGMKGMLAKLEWLTRNGAPAFGFHHSGMHDVENISMIVIKLLLKLFRERINAGSNEKNCGEGEIVLHFPVTSTWPVSKPVDIIHNNEC